ncbi:hypothetical protein MTsPCn9_14550 [Croceitalea sp. MTPC9]|uniref:hypothetical protein n=1 Tax=unclassified Croceitalea TaxID=2632280 RepID=UPI002B382857|nr:hypothetical protein MTsPCn6_14580 [Croceitalea sp. MTPC6]GMN16519.1 hypothetical protein MTsPCn9_14550 [Croceitalea sp. MTPC9]
MKPTFMIVLSFLIFSCSEVETAEDPILGIWMNELQSELLIEGETVTEQEWIFNDLYKGRFHGYRNGEVVYEMDYNWSNDNGVYTLTYNAGELDAITFRMEDTILRTVEGNVVAEREKYPEDIFND